MLTMELIIQAGLYVGPVVFMVLFFMSARKNTNNIFLGLSLLCIWGALFINELHNSKRILDYPHLTRTGNIFAYLIYPFLYLYIRNTFYPGKIWQKFDYLLLLPALFYMVDMFPFFFLKSAAEKRLSLRRIYRTCQKCFRSPKVGSASKASTCWPGISSQSFCFHFVVS